jgi:hypothetical protein
MAMFAPVPGDTILEGDLLKAVPNLRPHPNRQRLIGHRFSLGEQDGQGAEHGHSGTSIPKTCGALGHAGSSYSVHCPACQGWASSVPGGRTVSLPGPTSKPDPS